jgi:hypothetical protein
MGSGDQNTGRIGCKCGSAWPSEVAGICTCGTIWTAQCSAASICHNKESAEQNIALVKIWLKKLIIHLSDCSVVALRVERDATRVSSVGHDPANPHHKVPVDEAIMRSPKHIPGDWDALQILIHAHP